MTMMFAGCLGLVFAIELNPTVEVLPRPTAAVPRECEESLAPAVAPRIVVSDIPEVQPVRAEAPPSARLRAQLRAVHEAANRGNREAFRAALADAKATLAAHPAGGERDAAAAAVRIYDDIDRVWTWQQTSPTGAFFDDSSELNIARSYPDFERSVADATLVTGGRRLFPSRETREFLVREAQRRTGGSAPAPRTTRAEPRRSSGAATAPVAGRRRSGGAPVIASAVSPVPAVRRRAGGGSTGNAVAAEPPPVATETATPPVSTETVVAPVAETVAPEPVTTTTVSPTSTTTQPPAPQPARRNILIPALVVVAAVGFLFFLFRASR